MKQDPIVLTTPLDRKTLATLRAGDQIELSGDVLVFRDQIHRMLCDMLDRGEQLPFDLDGQAVYYCGPTAPRHGMAVGAAGPTTASRMDRFTGPLLQAGLAMTIGKGNRSVEVQELLRQHGAVYMVAIGGAGALMAKHIVRAELIAFEELGPEAARRFTFDRMPLIVGIDMSGASAFRQGGLSCM